MTRGDWDLALGLVQLGFILVLVVLAGVAIGMHLRDRARRVPVLRDELAAHLHDWVCDSGPWPHSGECVPADETRHGAWTLLAQCADRGYGRVPDDLASTAYGYPEEFKVNQHLPRRALRSVAGDES